MLATTSDNTTKIIRIDSTGALIEEASILNCFLFHYIHIMFDTPPVFNADGNQVAVAMAMNEKGSCPIKIYSMNKECVWTMTSSVDHKGEIRSLILNSIENKQFLIINDHQHVHLYSMASDNTWSNKDSIKHKFNDLPYFSADYRYMAMNSLVKLSTLNSYVPWGQSHKSDYAHIYKMDYNAEKWTIQGNIQHDEGIGDMSFSPDGRNLVSISDDGTSQLYGMNSENDYWTKKGTIKNNTYTTCPAPLFSPDSRCVVTVGSRNSATIWSLSLKELFNGTEKYIPDPSRILPLIVQPLGANAWVNAFVDFASGYLFHDR